MNSATHSDPQEVLYFTGKHPAYPHNVSWSVDIKSGKIVQKIDFDCKRCSATGSVWDSHDCPECDGCGWIEHITSEPMSPAALFKLAQDIDASDCPLSEIAFTQAQFSIIVDESIRAAREEAQRDTLPDVSASQAVQASCVEVTF